MPDRLDVLTGSCVQIPCSFDIPAQHMDIFNSTIRTTGVWIKENPNFGGRPYNVIFNSSKTVNRYQGKITGNMSQKNCTTVLFNVTTSYTNKYFFRIESQPFRATDTEKSVDIVVRDLPSSPILTVSGEVKEGTPVSLNCSAVAPCPEHPPELTWTLPTQFTPENQLQENPDQTKSVLSTVTFTPSYLLHEKNITCTAVYPVGTSNKTAEHNMMLNVSFSPKDTSASISPADPALMGSCVNLTCSSTANPPVTNFTWFKISEGKPAQVASGLSYTLNVTVGDGGLYFCEARNSHGRGKSKEVQLAIKGQEETVNTMVFGIAAGTLGVLLLISLLLDGGETRGSTMDLKGQTIHRDRTPRLIQFVLTRPQLERNQRNLQKTSLKRSNMVT
ncbi:myelin-associated glycoprotein-like isoform X2 [Salvelinus alpinus]